MKYYLKRFFAFSIDILLIQIIFWIINNTINYLIYEPLLLIVYSIIFVAYFWFYEYLDDAGVTLGKKLVNLKLVGKSQFGFGFEWFLRCFFILFGYQINFSEYIPIYSDVVIVSAFFSSLWLFYIGISIYTYKKTGGLLFQDVISETQVVENVAGQYLDAPAVSVKMAVGIYLLCFLMLVGLGGYLHGSLLTDERYGLASFEQTMEYTIFEKYNIRTDIQVSVYEADQDSGIQDEEEVKIEIWIPAIVWEVFTVERIVSMIHSSLLKSSDFTTKKGSYTIKTLGDTFNVSISDTYQI